MERAADVRGPGVGRKFILHWCRTGPPEDGTGGEPESPAELSSQEVGTTRASSEPPEPVHRHRNDQIGSPCVDHCSMAIEEKRGKAGGVKLSSWPLRGKHGASNVGVVSSQGHDAVIARPMVTATA